MIDNEGGGKTVVLVAGDDLKKVPRSHRALITDPIREAFPDPPANFARLAERCPFGKMARWIKALVSQGQWELQLNWGWQKRWSLAGFYWSSEKVRGATIALPKKIDLRQYPKPLQEYYSLVDGVNWNRFGCAGGMEPAGKHTPLTSFNYDYYGDKVIPDKTFVWGTSPCGDLLLFTSDGRGGWLCHENGHIHLLGTIEETINWIYSELLADRCPEYDYKWGAGKR
jgi:hypothetical protein